jgi:hypothetical protein
MQSDYEPQIIELEPEKAPRTTAIILLVCGLMGVGFLMVNVFFTGEDPYQSMTWPDEEDGNIQERGNILPNVWRGREEADEEEEVTDQINARKTLTRPTTNPYQIPGTERLLRPTMPGVQAPKLPTDPRNVGAPTAPGTPGTPAAPGGAPGNASAPGSTFPRGSTAPPGR